MKTKLERAILNGARKAQRSYQEMTGYWLWHAPESFIMATVATHITTTRDTSVFMDCTPKKIKRDQGLLGPGRPERGQRFDLVIWSRVRDAPKAIVEIKKSAAHSGLYSDRNKLKRYRRKHPTVAAYLLAYSEATGEGRKERLKEQGQEAAKGLKCRFVGSTFSHESTKDEKGRDWDWAVHLIGVDNRR